MLLVILGMAGCAELFEFNLFQSLDPISLPTRAELDSMPEGEALDYLEGELSSPGFTDKLTEDGQAFSDVEMFLNDTMTNSSDPESRKRAAVLYADLQLSASGAAEVVNNIATLLEEELGDITFSSDTEVEDFLQALMPDIIPADALASKEAFDALLTGFQDAWTGYDTFGGPAGLGGDPAVPASINMGDVAQKALFSFLVAEALRPGGLYDTEADARSALWDMARGEEPPTPNGGGDFTDPFTPGGSLKNIFDAAGISW